MTLIQTILNQVEDELNRSEELYGSMSSLHEAYAVIREELDEYWDEVKKKHPCEDAVQEELIQIAAMAVRSIVDLVPRKE